MIAGIDYSTRAVDVVLLDETTDRATWHRFELEGADAFDRARSVAMRMPGRAMSFWDDVLAVGIEEPRGPGNGALLRVQGAVLAQVPHRLLVHPLIPSVWRKTVGLPGNASKEQVRQWAIDRWGYLAYGGGYQPEIRDFNQVLAPARSWEGIASWSQDGVDAYCVALATRTLIQREAA